MRCQRQKAAPSRNECLTSCRVFKCKLQQSTTFVWNQSQQRDMLYILPCSTYAHCPSIVFLFFISNMSSLSHTHTHGSDPLLHLDKHIQLSDPQPQSVPHPHARDDDDAGPPQPDLSPSLPSLSFWLALSLSRIDNLLVRPWVGLS